MMQLVGAQSQKDTSWQGKIVSKQIGQAVASITNADSGTPNCVEIGSRVERGLFILLKAACRSVDSALFGDAHDIEPS